MLAHGSRQVASWLIFDVGKTSRVHALSLSPRRRRAVNEYVSASRRSTLRSAFAHLQRQPAFARPSLPALEAIRIRSVHSWFVVSVPSVRGGRILQPQRSEEVLSFSFMQTAHFIFSRGLRVRCPNKAPEPTEGAVMPRAMTVSSLRVPFRDARGTPAPSVAHL